MARSKAEEKATPKSLAGLHGTDDRDALKLLAGAERGRLPALLKIKRDRMAASAFSYFRGAAPVMAYDLAQGPHSGVVCQMCGDAHVQNLGAYSGPDGRLIFDINDFDESMPGPFEWDLKRMATSFLLAADAATLGRRTAEKAVDCLLKTYCELVHRFAAMPVLEVARYQVHRLGTLGPISKILRSAERSTPAVLLKKLTEPASRGRRFRQQPPLLKRVPRAEAKKVLAALHTYREVLLPERRHFLDQYRPADVAFKVVGTGSVGLRDFCVYLQGNGEGDPLFLQLKEEAPSAYAPYLPAGPRGNQGQRVVEAQRAMQLQSDPMLGWTRMGGRDYLVRQLNDHKASVDMADLDATGLAQYATVCGELLARGHSRSGLPGQIAEYIGGGRRFRAAILKFAGAYAAQTVKDWKALRTSRKG